jgi:hypothetical protein
MARKCLPGTICLENTTLVVFLVLLIIIGYLYYSFLTKTIKPTYGPIGMVPLMPPPQQSYEMVPIGMTSNVMPNVMMDPYAPPVKSDGYNFTRPSSSYGISNGISLARPAGIPVNIETRGLQQEYSQMGIITREGKTDMILPLMGRRLVAGLDKWQYYTISNTGAINTKLPIRFHGRSCSGEYGCDCLMNGDIVYVEGYQDTFRVTLYDTAKFQYIPYI